MEWTDSLPLVDTHCHLELIRQKLKLSSWQELQASRSDWPEAMVQISCDPDEFEDSLAILNGWSQVWGGFGVHPHDASKYDDAVESKLQKALSHPRCIALGEIGLDYHYNQSPPETQKQIFARQLKLADPQKATVIHTREANEDTLAILKNFPWTPQHRIHIHCYTGNQTFAQQLLSLPAQVYFGFTGILTFPSSEDLRQVALGIPLDRLLLETDSPYLAPVPQRGKTAFPGMVIHTLQKLAEIRQQDPHALAQIIRKNTHDCYGI